MPAILFLNYAWRTDGRAGGGVGPNVSPNAGVLLGPTVKILIEQAFCVLTSSTLTQSDDKPPWRNQLGGKGPHGKALVKMHMK